VRVGFLPALHEFGIVRLRAVDCPRWLEQV
jgi:hypothetical protein